jgi:hypothetical protein
MFGFNAYDVLAPTEIVAWMLAGGIAAACLVGTVLVVALTLRPLFDREEAHR